MPRLSSGHNGFLLLSDTFNDFTYTIPLKGKSKSVVIEALDEVLKKSGIFQEIQSDAELKYISDYCKEKNIYYRSKQLLHSANVAENRADIFIAQENYLTVTFVRDQ